MLPAQRTAYGKPDEAVVVCAGIFVDALQHFLTTGQDLPLQTDPADDDDRPSEVCWDSRAVAVHHAFAPLCVSRPR